MKSFIDNLSSSKNTSSSNSLGKISQGKSFQSLQQVTKTAAKQNSGSISNSTNQAHSDPGSKEKVANPDGPDAPKVEYIKNNGKIQKILVTFGDQKVEIDCQYSG